MVVNAGNLNRMKRRITADLYDFVSFPSPSNFPISDGPFRSNIKTFLTRHALLCPPSSLFPQLLTWQIILNVGDLSEGLDRSATVCVDVVEEDVARSRSVYCDQCRVVGWGGHPVCTKRYHFIIKADGNSISGPIKSCPNCGGEVSIVEPRCQTCNHVMTSEDIEDSLYQQLEGTTHLLHGVVHANGYGHLLRVNGREGGSRLLSGTHIMDFWDRLCKYLGVRTISVMDVSKKYGLEYRLLHAITNGHPWYGDWGYEFGTRSFALTHDAYRDAVETLSTLSLSIFVSRGRKPHTNIQDLILYYQSLSETELVNMKDLFTFLMSLVHDSPKSLKINSNTFKKRRFCARGAPCAWASRDVNHVQNSMVRVLRAVSGSSWVSWRTLRGAVCKAVPPEQLDYCLKELSGKQSTDGMTVHSRCNPDTGVLEFKLGAGCNSPQNNSASLFSKNPSRYHVLRDMRFLYESLLHPLTMLSFGPNAKRETLRTAACRLLDCKHFVKDYRPETTFSLNNLAIIHLFCQVDLIDQSLGSPPELITLAANATLTNLKVEAFKAFQEVYLMFKGLQVEGVVDHQGVEDSKLVKLWFNPLQTVRIRGRCPLKNVLGQFGSERGVEKWTVDCSCGTNDDDGERMLACDICSVWQHTRCAGISDFQVVPAKFVCNRCRTISLAQARCKGESMVVASGARGGGKSLAMLFDVR